MTARERYLMLAVAVAGTLTLAFYLIKPGVGLSGNGKPLPLNNLPEARRLLRSEHNIRCRYGAVSERLNILQTSFLKETDPIQAQIQLLNLVENLAAQSGLVVQNKNTLDLSKGEIGVALEGKSSAVSVITFMQQTTAAKVGIKIKRLQLHSISEKRLLSYQIIISTYLLPAKGK